MGIRTYLNQFILCFKKKWDSIYVQKDRFTFKNKKKRTNKQIEKPPIVQ